MQQIIIITDGCSNVGISPVVAAAHAAAEGIAVHVVGVVDQGEIGERGAEEISEIARAGDGLSRIVPSHLLSRTMQAMTHKSVVHTIRQTVNEELKQILGTTSIEELPPEQRSQVVGVIDGLSESSALRVALLIDTSASMKPKLLAVEDAIRDLMLSLQARKGKSEIAVFYFPGKDPELPAVRQLDWTSDLAKLNVLYYKLNMKGTTPTGPALLQVVAYCAGKPGANALAMEQSAAVNTRPRIATGEDGMLSDYVV